VITPATFKTSKSTIMGKLIGGIIIIVGLILLIGNVTRWWPTISYAGTITIFIGWLIIKISDDD
jgi:uncharacterized membrane protein YkgB